jgi:hypothetical protein
MDVANVPFNSRVDSPFSPGVWRAHILADRLDPETRYVAIVS